MKMKLAIIALTFGLTGCAGMNHPYDGNLVYKGGTGLVYQRVSNQCGGNCDKYATMKVERVEFPGEREALERTIKAEKRSAIARKCQQFLDLELAKVESKYYSSIESGDFNTAEKYKAKYQKVGDKYYSIINQCVEENIK
ncbi:hypothetical protein [Serratia phage vB_SspM_LC53]|nr:hypothetical protein [Serratia phage vB_SspM_LC53]